MEKKKSEDKEEDDLEKDMIWYLSVKTTKKSSIKSMLTKFNL